MANVFAVHSVGNSIVTFLRNTYPQQIAGRVVKAFPSAQIDAELAGRPRTLTLLLHLPLVAGHVHLQVALAGNVGGQIGWKAVGVV